MKYVSQVEPNRSFVCGAPSHKSSQFVNFTQKKNEWAYSNPQTRDTCSSLNHRSNCLFYRYFHGFARKIRLPIFLLWKFPKSFSLPAATLLWIHRQTIRLYHFTHSFIPRIFILRNELPADVFSYPPNHHYFTELITFPFVNPNLPWYTSLHLIFHLHGFITDKKHLRSYHYTISKGMRISRIVVMGTNI